MTGAWNWSWLRRQLVSFSHSSRKDIRVDEWTVRVLSLACLIPRPISHSLTINIYIYIYIYVRYIKNVKIYFITVSTTLYIYIYSYLFTSCRAPLPSTDCLCICLFSFSICLFCLGIFASSCVLLRLRLSTQLLPSHYSALGFLQVVVLFFLLFSSLRLLFAHAK